MKGKILIWMRMRAILLLYCFGSLGAFAIEYDASKAMVVNRNDFDYI